MDLRCNILSLYRRTGYKYAPVQLNLCPSQWNTFRKLTGEGVSLAEYFDYPQGFQTMSVPQIVPVQQDVDWTQYYPDSLKPGTSYDIWGIAREPGSTESHHMTRMHHPMQAFNALEQIQAYPWPDFENAQIDHIQESVNNIHRQGRAALFSMSCTIWETSWYIRGMPELMIDMATENEKAVWLLDKVTETACYRARIAAQAGVDIIHLGDDVGMQSRIMMSKPMYREWLKPRLAKVIASAKAIKPNTLIYYHSCGYITPFIDDFIDVGIEILNPVQPECMSFDDIHAQYGSTLSFNGTLGTQSTMPFGSASDVTKVVLDNLGIAGAEGGLAVAPTHMVEPEVPWENIEAYVTACKTYSGL